MNADEARPEGRDMSEPRPQVLSLGAGIQSTTLALLAAEGALPKPDAAIFADTGWEPRAVYEHLALLEEALAEAGIPLIRVSQGNLRDDTLDTETPGIPIPAFITSANTKDARGALLSRQCTSNYKLYPIYRYVRRMLGAKVTTNPCRYCKGEGRRILPQSKYEAEEREGTCTVCRGSGNVERTGPAPKGQRADLWVGFSTDEIGRVGPARVPYVTSVFPLLDLNMSRKDCERWLGVRGWQVAKSACIGCPYHGNRMWRDLRDNHPDEWADAVEFDHGLRSMPGSVRRRGAEAFLHSSRLPLDQAPIDRVTSREWKDRQGDLLDAIAEAEMELEENGDPDGCSPYACRSGEAVT